MDSKTSSGGLTSTQPADKPAGNTPIGGNNSAGQTGNQEVNGAQADNGDYGTNQKGPTK